MTPKRKTGNTLSLVNLGRSFGDQFAESSANMLANGMVYSSLIALVPCLAVIYTILNMFGILDPFVSVLEEWVLDTFGAEVGSNLVGYLSVFTQNAMGMGVVSLLFFGFTFILLVDKLFTCVNKIYHTINNGNPALRYLKYLAIVATAILVIVVSVTSMVRFNSLSLAIQGIEALSGIQMVLQFILPHALSFGFLLLINLFVPNVRVKLKPALLGSAVGALGVWFLSWLFRVIVLRFVRYSVIYGSLATLVFFFLYLSFLWKIVFASVTFTYVFQSETTGVKYHI